VCTTTNLPLSNGIKIVSVLQRLHGEIGRTIFDVQKRDEQTNTQTDKKTQRFWPPRRRVKSEPHQTWHGDRGPRARSCTSKTSGVWCIVSPLGGAENLGITRSRQLKSSITPCELHNALRKSNEILTANAHWNEVQSLLILWKSRKGYAPAGHLYSTFWSNLSKNFSFGAPIP